MTQIDSNGRATQHRMHLSEPRGTRKNGRRSTGPRVNRSIRRVSRDTVGPKQLEERLLRAQRLETAGVIAGQVAHDMRNSLGVLIGYAELIRETLPEGHPGSVFCYAMKGAAERAVDISSDVLTLSSRGAFDPQPTDVNRVAEQIFELLADAPNSLELELDFDPDLPLVRGSSTQLWRVLSNLVVNARDAMRDSGVLTVKTESVYLDRPIGQYRVVKVGDYVRLTVSDTGCGIPPEIRDEIFDAFFTTKGRNERRGTGLGLSVVKNVVEDHGGYIDLQSEVGKGTTFSVYLPAYRRPESSALARSSAEGAPAQYLSR